GRQVRQLRAAQARPARRPLGPLLAALRPRAHARPGRLHAFGALVAAGRFATIVAIVALVQAPAVAWAILAPGMLVHVTFGALSGYVSSHLVRATAALRPAAQGAAGAEHTP